MRTIERNPLFSARFERTTLSYRIWIIVAGCCCLFLTLAGRLCWVSLWSIQPTVTPIASHNSRGDILDRCGTVLASSIPTYSIYAHPTRVPNKEEAAASLHALFPTRSVSDFLKLLNSPKPFVWIARHISPTIKMQVHALGIEGLGILKEQKRVYPHDNLFSHVLGLTNIDQEGISGVEQTFNKHLQKKKEPLHLSVDTRLQHCVYDQLSETIKKFDAAGGNALLVDMHTGEILAMVSLPDFSPMALSSASPQDFFNRNTSGVYEFGSLLKIFNIGMALDSKIATLGSVYDASNPLQLGRFKITDFKGQNRPLTVREAFIYSSNIANAKIALDAGMEKQQAFFKKMGFFSRVPLELPGSASPLIPKTWSKPLLVTASYGYGLALTPLHLIQGLQTLLMGRHIPLTLLRCKEPAIPGPRIVSTEVSSQIAALMGMAVQEGQAQKAAAHTCLVGAKTGTANQLVNGHYREKKNLTSCISVFPIEAPRYALLVCVDQAKANASTHNFATAGWIAAPVVSAIVDTIAPLLHLINPETPSLEQTIHSIVTTQAHTP